MSGIGIGIGPGVFLFVAAVGLGLLWVAVALALALRTYSRSRLEDLCERHRRPERAAAIAHEDEPTERALGALAVALALVLAALLGAAADSPALGSRAEILMAVALVIAALGHVLAGVVGRVFAERVLDALWPVALALRSLALPLSLASRGVEELAYKLTATPDSPHRPASVEVEIHSATDDEEDVEGELPERAREILERVVELSRRDVGEVMTPRTSIVALPATVTARAAARAVHESGRSRIPLFGENRDDIVGVLYAKDLTLAMIDSDDQDSVIPRALARVAYCVPESKNAVDLLDEFRTQRTQIALVLDEYGGVAGLVTLEDLLEEVVGPIDDEHDIPTPDDPVLSLGGTRFEVGATVPLEALNERLGLRLPTDGDIQTVGGFAFNTLGHLPAPGESFRSDGVEFTILDVVDHAIRRLRLDLSPAEVGT